MIVVSNTSPLHYLVLVQAVDVLRDLFGQIIIPRAVADELAHPAAPEPVRRWIASPPPWVDVREPAASDPRIQLHPGERDALSLALELGADLVLVDDRAARRVARELGLTVTGTLGVIDKAARRQLVNLPALVDALRRTNYRIREDVLVSLLENHSRRHGQEDEAAEGSGGAGNE